MLGKKNLRVDVIGFVDDPYPLISGALASIAPIRLGGGIQNKVLESLAVGANVVVSKMVADFSVVIVFYGSWDVHNVRLDHTNRNSFDSCQ